MKGRFRKGKKAFKSGRKDRLALKYMRWRFYRALAKRREQIKEGYLKYAYQ